MAFPKLRLMISSRSDKFSVADANGGKMSLRTARTKLKATIEAQTYFDAGLVEVWINEKEYGQYDDAAWDECIQQAIDCDLFICLYDGSAGWVPDKGSLGICQGEFDTALRLSPGKVKVIQFDKPKIRSNNTADMAFQDALKSASRFAAFIPATWEELEKNVLNLVREMVLKAAHEGVREFRKSSGNLGQALDWSRLTFEERSAAIAKTIREAMSGRGATAVAQKGELAIVPFDNEQVLLACHGAPRSLSLSASRELVGQPFLSDHNLIKGLDPKVIGPIHLIGCPKGVTETQAIAMLGFPDFIVVEGSFGVYAADRVQRIQLCLLANCNDPGSTRNAVDRFFEWLDRSREFPNMITRAKARRKIIQAILTA